MTQPAPYAPWRSKPESPRRTAWRPREPCDGTLGMTEPGAMRRARSEESDQKVALSPQAQEPEEFGFSMEKPEASSDSFQSMTVPER